MSTPGVPAMYGVTIVLTALDCIVVPLRFYRRRRQKQALMMDDWFTICALVRHFIIPVDTDLTCLFSPTQALNIGMSMAVWIGKSRSKTRKIRSPHTEAVFTHVFF